MNEVGAVPKAFVDGNLKGACCGSGSKRALAVISLTDMQATRALITSRLSACVRRKHFVTVLTSHSRLTYNIHTTANRRRPLPTHLNRADSAWLPHPIAHPPARPPIRTQHPSPTPKSAPPYPSPPTSLPQSVGNPPSPPQSPPLAAHTPYDRPPSRPKNPPSTRVEPAAPVSKATSLV